MHSSATCRTAGRSSAPSSSSAPASMWPAASGGSPASAEPRFIKAPELARMQLVGAGLAQEVDGLEADLQVLLHALAIEGIGHGRELDLAMQRLVGDAQQRAVGHAQAEAVGGDGGALHVDGDGARLVETPVELVVAQLPVAVVGRGYGARAHARLQLCPL